MAVCFMNVKNAVYGSMFYECKKCRNTQVVYKNLHNLSSFMFIPCFSKATVSISEGFHNAPKLTNSLLLKGKLVK
jgi:hypothetical protein